jgi:hypothetical protein
MNKESGVRALRSVIASGDITRSEIARVLDIHPSQVSRIASGEFKRMDGHALQVCKYAQSIAALKAAKNGNLALAGELEAKVLRLVRLSPQVATSLSNMLDALEEILPLRKGQP